MKWLQIVFLALPMWASCYAGEARPLAEDPLVERRMLAITAELRCLVCQNESLAGSHSDLAQDLRNEVRTLIKTGQSDAQIMEFMVSRYGDFVRYRPPVKPVTWVLWFGPLLLLIAAVVFLVRLIRKQQRGDSSQRPDAQQRAKAQSLLQDKPTSS